MIYEPTPFPWIPFLTTILLFFVPGAVIVKAADLLRAEDTKAPGDRLVDIFLWSLLNWGFNTPLFFLARFYDLSFNAPTLFSFFGLWVFIFCPILIALIYSRLRAHAPQSRATARAFATGWDFFFARRQACWVICHFANGQKVGGYFGPNSSATSFPREPELFLEEIWRVGDDGTFEEKLTTAGAVVRCAECLWIEFFDHDSNLKGQLKPARPAAQLMRDANGFPAFSYAPAAPQTAATPPTAPKPVAAVPETVHETNHYEPVAPETFEVR